jgi:tRNA-Thr(GGU) m(6)t(6)A37 methyltransferase TsaA
MIDHVMIEIIGYVSSCFKEKFGTPRQCGLVPAAEARLKLVAPFNRRETVRGLEDFSHIWINFLFHQARGDGWKTTVRPPRLGGDRRMGVWATRSPHRPNFMGLSVVELKAIDFSNGVELVVAGVDFLDGTPVLDIKPYLPSSDSIRDATEGWAGQECGALEVGFSAAATHFCTQYEAETGVPLYQLISEILKEDPRPASQKDKKKTYGMRLCNVNVRWRVSGSVCLVLGCEKFS